MHLRRKVKKSKGGPKMKLQGVCKGFDEVKVLKDFDLTVGDKEITCILGPSGCGKSTLLNIMAGIVKPDLGDIAGSKKRIGYVFQEDRLLPWRTVKENIKLVNKKASDEKIKELVELVGLGGFGNKYPSQLSGGMRQRCSIARAFNFESELLLMDEPFKSLDYDLRIYMVKSLVEIWEKWNNSVVFVTHEIDEALLLGNKIVVLSKNPCTVKTLVNIDTPQRLRTLEDPELVNIRIKIIKELTEPQEKCEYQCW